MKWDDFEYRFRGKKGERESRKEKEQRRGNSGKLVGGLIGVGGVVAAIAAAAVTIAEGKAGWGPVVDDVVGKANEMVWSLATQTKEVLWFS